MAVPGAGFPQQRGCQRSRAMASGAALSGGERSRPETLPSSRCGAGRCAAPLPPPAAGLNPPPAGLIASERRGTRPAPRPPHPTGSDASPAEAHPARKTFPAGSWTLCFKVARRCWLLGYLRSLKSVFRRAAGKAGGGSSVQSG